MPESYKKSGRSQFRRFRMGSALVLAAGLLLGNVPYAATAAPSKATVSIGAIPTKYVQAKKKTTIKPALVKKGTVNVRSATLTVTSGKKTVAKNKTSAALGAGTYKVQTKITYRVKSGNKWSRSKAASKTQTLVIKKAKVSAKVNSAAGKKELLAWFNAKRMANKLKPLTLVKDTPDSWTKRYFVQVRISSFYSFEKTKWPTAKEWVRWFEDGPGVKRLIKDKSAIAVKMDNSSFVYGTRLNILDIYAYQGTGKKEAPQAPKTPQAQEPRSDIGDADARTRIINGIQQMRADAKLSPFTVTVGEPSLRSGEDFSRSATNGPNQVSTVKEFLAESGVVDNAKDPSLTYVGVSIAKKGSSYEVSARFYGVSS